MYMYMTSFEPFAFFSDNSSTPLIFLIGYISIVHPRTSPPVYYPQFKFLLHQCLVSYLDFYINQDSYFVLHW